MTTAWKFGIGALALGTLGILGAGCGGDSTNDIPFEPGTSGGVRNQEQMPDGLQACLPRCQQDDECRDCAMGRNHCDVSTNTCIQCGPNAGGAGCPGGLQCNANGRCVQPGTAECPLNSDGRPNITCASDADCGNCAFQFSVCNPTTNTCGNCTPDSMENCHVNQFCSPEGMCTDKCPQGCGSDGQCSQCGDPGGVNANVCVEGDCAECRPGTPGSCAGGGDCDDHGSCIPRCGLNEAADDRSCNTSADCAACGEVAQEDFGQGDAQGVLPAAEHPWICATVGATKQCVPPINDNGDIIDENGNVIEEGGGLGEGEEGGPGAGCSALGGFTLPSPFNKVTNTCDDDSGCATAGVGFDVGGLVGKLSGLSGVNSGTSDTTMLYPMKRCAKMEILGNEVPCGICVPCKEDADCSNIDIMNSVGSIFGPVGSLVSRVVSKAIFGDNPPIIHMYCKKVLGEFGACLPCSSLLSSCGQGDKPTEPQPGADDCTGLARGWYCSGLSRAAGFFCNGSGGVEGSAHFCTDPGPHCMATGPGRESKATTKPGEGAATAIDGTVPACSESEDPNFASREIKEGGDAGAGGGGAVGVLPL